MNVGIVGCGSIVGQYLQTLDHVDAVRLVAVADVDQQRAIAVAAGRDGTRACSVDDLLSAGDIDLVVNLTVPVAHAEIGLRVIAARKSLYNEKPLAETTDQGRQLLTAAAAAGVQVGCAPDTVLGTGIQTARKAVDDGLIGTPISATAIMVTPGHERWHPNPDFYYLPGGGPLMDMGPYYVSALVTLLGPVASVIGAASRSRSHRTITSGPRQGEQIPVAVDTHVTAVLRHDSGALSTLIMSFDAVATQAANIEVHGDLGSLIVPDPNRFTGTVKLATTPTSGWKPLPVSAGYVDASRGCGIADLSMTGTGGQPRTDGRLAYHVLDVLESVLTSARNGAQADVASTALRPRPVPLSSLAVLAASSA